VDTVWSGAVSRRFLEPSTALLVAIKTKNLLLLHQFGYVYLHSCAIYSKSSYVHFLPPLPKRYNSIQRKFTFIREHVPLWFQQGDFFITHDREAEVLREASAPVQILNSFVRRLVYRPAAAQANSIYYARCPFNAYTLSGIQFLNNNSILCDFPVW
jgi:hypothetical protein